MAVTTIKAVFQCDVQKVWNVVTSLENYSWRSDLSKIEVVNEKTIYRIYEEWICN